MPTAHPAQSFGHWVRQQRKALDLTQVFLASALDEGLFSLDSPDVADPEPTAARHALPDRVHAVVRGRLARLSTPVVHYAQRVSGAFAKFDCPAQGGVLRHGGDASLATTILHEG